MEFLLRFFQMSGGLEEKNVIFYHLWTSQIFLFHSYFQFNIYDITKYLPWQTSIFKKYQIQIIKT